MSTATLPRPPLAIRRRAAVPESARDSRPNWIRWFVILEIVFQLLQLTSLTTGSFRSAIRVAAFSISLLFLVFLQGKGRPHPSAKPALGILLIVALSFFNPETSSILSGVAQFCLYLAILAPLFWIPRLALDGRMFRSVLLTFWGFHTLSSIFGILQVYFPGKLQPNVSAMVTAKGSVYLKGLMFTLANGQKVFRPMGLTDLPGGAGTAGFYAVLFALGFVLTEKRMLQRWIYIASMFVGMTCIYLSQVRTMLVILLCTVLALIIILVLRGSAGKVATLGTVIVSVVLVSFLWAVSLGGSKISQRVASLTKDAPVKTYYSNRGQFLEYTVNELLPKYPLGAGLGRWGMTNTYFGDHRTAIWAEIQWTGWLLDGGVPLIVAYLIALIIAFRFAFTIALTRQSDLGFWGAVLVAYNLGAFALTFGHPLFIGQMGTEFWMLNAALFSASLSDNSWQPARQTLRAAFRSRATVTRRRVAHRPLPQPRDLRTIPE